MKKKLLLLTVLVIAFVMLLAMSASATITTYDDAQKTNIQISTDDLVVFDDGFTCPSAYICKDQTGLSLDFSWINEKASKSYTVANVIELDIPQGITFIGQYFFSKNTTLKKCSIPDSVTTIEQCMFQEASALEELVMEHDESDELTEFPNWMVWGCTSLKAFSMPDCITAMTGIAQFNGCTNLTALYLSKNLESIGSGAGGTASFGFCPNLFFVNEPFTYDNIPEQKPRIYYFPTKLQSLPSGGEVFKNSTNLNDVLVFPTGVTEIANGWAFNGSNAVSIVFLGDMVNVSTTGNAWNSGITIYFCNEADKSAADLTGLGGNPTKVYCHAAGNTTHLVEKDLGTEATCITNKFVKSYCFCGTLVEDKEIANTATGIHTFVTNDCTESVKCTGDENCVAMSVAKEKHALVNTLSYANGFDKAGVYNYYCENEGCTIADKAVRDAEKSPIITFKGYSVPEAASYLGINAGYHIDTTLLSMYETLNEKKVTIGLLMVNAEDVADVSDILNAEGELVANVRGFSVTMTSNNYSDISIEIKNFQLGTEQEKGNYYKLSLVSALFVKVDDKIDYLQDTIGDEKEDNRVTTTSGVVFDTITASRVYASKNITPQ